MNKKIKSILGFTIIEALVSTVIVGIGFVAVFQMVNYSVRSIDTSGERTKANFLASMLAEDLIGYKDNYYGVSDPGSISIDANGNAFNAEGDALGKLKKFADQLIDKEFDGMAECRRGLDTGASDTRGTKPGIFDSDATDAVSYKQDKWARVFDQYKLKCTSDRDIKKMKVYKLCKWGDVCPDYTNPSITDDGLYIGRIQFNLNDGRKRKVLYFQSDYKIRKGE